MSGGFKSEKQKRYLRQKIANCISKLRIARTKESFCESLFCSVI